jgi:hypothetical protein
MRPLGLHFYLGISQSVFATLEVSALLKRSPILLRHFPKSGQYPLGIVQMVSKSFSNVSQHGLDISFTFPSKQCVFLLLKLKNGRHNRKIYKPTPALLLIMICSTILLIAKLKLVRLLSHWSFRFLACINKLRPG